MIARINIFPNVRVKYFEHYSTRDHLREGGKSLFQFVGIKIRTFVKGKVPNCKTFQSTHNTYAACNIRAIFRFKINCSIFCLSSTSYWKFRLVESKLLTRIGFGLMNVAELTNTIRTWRSMSTNVLFNIFSRIEYPIVNYRSFSCYCFPNFVSLLTT